MSRSGTPTLATALGANPEFFPYELDPVQRSVRFIRLTEQDYVRASFLDPRVLTANTLSRTLPLKEVESAVAASALTEACDFIFHIGHVGSTLLSRFLGSSRRVFALREPLILRTLTMQRVSPGEYPVGPAKAEFETRLATFIKLWSRTYHPGQRACIKATSFVSELAATILARSACPRAIFMYVRPESYLATILAGPNSRQEFKLFSSSRLERLQSRSFAMDMRLADLSEGETVAMGWLTEMTALAAAAECRPDQIMWLDFDRFLEEPAVSLSHVFSHLQISAEENEVMAILSGGEAQRYSKAQEFPYDADLRRSVLDQARHEHSEEIARGLRWLERLETKIPAVQEALELNR